MLSFNEEIDFLFCLVNFLFFFNYFFMYILWGFFNSVLWLEEMLCNNIFFINLI